MWIIRNAAGDICGTFTNKPGAGNKMPDGGDEVPIYVEDDQTDPKFEQVAVDEAGSFAASQALKAQKKPVTVDEKLASVGLTVAELKDALK